MGAPSTRHLVLHNKGVSPPELNCFLKPCKQLSPEVAQLLSAADGPLVAYGNFAYQPEFLQVPAPNPLTVLHALSGGERCWLMYDILFILRTGHGLGHFH